MTTTPTRRRIALEGARSNPEPAIPEANPRRRRGRRRGRGRRRARRNPTMLGTMAAIGLSAAAIGVGYLGFKGWQRMKGQKKMPPGPVLASILVPGATLADAPQVVADVRGPVQLAVSGTEIPAGYTAAPTLRVLLENDDGTYTARAVKNVSLGATSGGVIDPVALSGRMPDGTTFDQRNDLPGGGSEPAIARLVTDVKGTFARDVYERMLNEIANKDVNWDDPDAHDAAIKHVLGIVTPQVDYSRGLEPYTAGDAPSIAWNTAQLLGAVANQSLMNKALTVG